MCFYIILSTMYLLLVYFDKKISSILSRKMWCIILLLPLFMLTALKTINVGTDSLAYYSFYEYFNNGFNVSLKTFSLEPGFVFILRLFNAINLTFYQFQFVYSIFVYTSLAYFFIRYSENLSFSVFFFITSRMFFFYLSVMRQTIALSFLLFSFPYLINKKFFRFFMLVLLASSFHSSALVFGLIYFIPFGEFKNFNFKTIIIGSIAMLSIIAAVPFILNIIDSSYMNYLSRADSYTGVYTVLFFIYNLFLSFLLFTTYKKEEIADSRYNKLLYNGQLFNIVFVVFSLYINIGNRISKYFILFYIITFPHVFKSENNVERNSLKTLAILTLMLLYYASTIILRPHWDGVIPYNTYIF